MTDEGMCQAAARAALEELGCPDINDTRINYLTARLGVMDGVVRVIGYDGLPRTETASWPPHPTTVVELVRELCAGEDKRNRRTSRKVGAVLRWRPFGAPYY